MTTRSDELWQKYQHDGWIGPTAFAAALHEYGALVRARDVEVCKEEHLLDPADTSDDIAYDNAVRDCATAISREPLP